MILRLGLVVATVIGTLCAQDRTDWQVGSQLKAGEQLRLSLKPKGKITGPFQSWTADQITIGAGTTRREDVAKLESFRSGAWGRGRKALVGAGIGAGALAGLAAATNGACRGFAPCFSRGEVALAAGALGAVIGAVTGALLPTRKTKVIYAAR